MEWTQLRAGARAAEVAARTAAEETEALLAARQRQEQSVSLVTAHYDCARVQVRNWLGGGGWRWWVHAHHLRARLVSRAARECTHLRPALKQGGRQRRGAAGGRGGCGL